jgi:flagellar hook-basal body complex protein FliE
MNINPISSNLVNLLSSDPIGTGAAGASRASQGQGSFANILSDALDGARNSDAADRASSLALLTGQTDDLVGVMLDIQKAELSLNLALQIRNKVIDAYNEVIRMQV